MLVVLWLMHFQPGDARIEFSDFARTNLLLSAGLSDAEQARIVTGQTNIPCYAISTTD